MIDRDELLLRAAIARRVVAHGMMDRCVADRRWLFLLRDCMRATSLDAV